MSGRVVGKTQVDMTQGPIVRQLLLFALPLLAGDLLQQLYNTADSIIVGNFVSKQALAAVGGSTQNIINVLIGLFTGISTGATVVISQHFGAKRREELNRSVRTTIWLTLILGGLFTVIGVAGSTLMLQLMDTPDDIFPVAREYLIIYFSGISGLILYNMCAGILRAIGDSRRPLYVLCFSSLLNISLDLLFVVAFGMGVAGAALATILSQFSSAFILLLLLCRTESLAPLRLRTPCLDRTTLARIFSIGLPAGIQKSIISFSNTIVMSYINKFESGAAAAWSVHLRLDQFIMRTIQSMSTATTTFVAQNVGANKPDRIRKGVRSSFWMALLVSVVYAIFFIAFREPLIRLFNKDADVLFYGSQIILLLTPLHPINTISQIQAGALRGQGDSKGPMVIMVSCHVVLRQIYLHLGWPYFQSFQFVISSYPFSWIICAVGILAYVRIKRRLHPETALYC